MVNRVIELKGDPGSDVTGFELGSASPQSGQQFVVEGVYTDGNTNIDYSLDINETTHIDALDGDNAPTASEPIPFEITLTDSDEVTALADETGSGSRTDVAVILLVRDTAKAGGQG
jgi:hypothetical protein